MPSGHKKSVIVSERYANEYYRTREVLGIVGLILLGLCAIVLAAGFGG